MNPIPYITYQIEDIRLDLTFHDTYFFDTPYKDTLIPQPTFIGLTHYHDQ